MAKEFDFTNVLKASASDEEVINLYAGLVEAFAGAKSFDYVFNNSGVDKDGKEDEEFSLKDFEAGLSILCQKFLQIKEKGDKDKISEEAKTKMANYEGLDVANGHGENIVTYFIKSSTTIKKDYKRETGVKKSPEEKPVRYDVFTFEDKLLKDVKESLEGCEATFRGSSKAFEDILDTAKNMKKAFEAEQETYDFERLMAASRCAQALVAKMDKYIEARKNKGGKMPEDTQDYTGKRYWTMVKLRDNLNNYMEESMEPMILAYNKLLKMKGVKNNKDTEERHFDVGFTTIMEEKIDKIVKPALWNGKFSIDVYSAATDIDKNEEKALRDYAAEHKNLTFEKADSFISKYRFNEIENKLAENEAAKNEAAKKSMKKNASGPNAKNDNAVPQVKPEDGVPQA